MPRISVIIAFMSWCCFIHAQNMSETHYQEIRGKIQSLPTDSAYILLQKEFNNKNYGSLDSAKLFNLMGNVSTIDGKQTMAIEYYTKAIALFTETHNTLGEIKSRLNLSSTYAELKEFTKASTELFTVNNLVHKANDSIYKLKINEYFAHLFYMQGQIDSTLHYLQLAIKAYEAGKDTSSMSRLYNNLAVIYKKEDLFHKAIAYNQKSLELSLLRNDELGTSESYNNLGVCYENLYDHTDSSEYLEKALSYYEEASILKSEHTHKWNSAIENLARLHRKLGNDSIANIYFAYLELSAKKDKTKRALEVYKDQMFYSLNQNDLADAAIYFTLYDSILVDMQRLQEADFNNMLSNQYKLFDAYKKQQAQQLLLKEEQNKRLLVEQKQIITQTVFAILMIIMLGMFYYLRQRKKYLSLKAEKENKQLHDAVLRTQMNPHFIFNVLTAIQNSVLQENPLVTASYVSRFAKLARQTFNFANVERVSLSEDMNALTNYIETQKMRFGDKFSYQFEIDTLLDTDKIHIPPMMLQPLVENAIHHGFKQLKRVGNITISIKKYSQEKISFCVSDNGVGFQATKGDGKTHALEILKKRLFLFNEGDQQSFSITSNAEGTQVYFELSVGDAMIE